MTDTKPRVYAITGEDTSHRTRRWLGITWTEADYRSAIITVGGTIVGGLILVVLVGLALTLGTPLKRVHNIGWFLAFLVVTIVACFLGARWGFRGTPAMKNRYWRFIINATSLSLLAGATVYLLALIGMSAGLGQP